MIDAGCINAGLKAMLMSGVVKAATSENSKVPHTLSVSAILVGHIADGNTTLAVIL